MKKLMTVVFCLVTFAYTYASSNKSKAKDVNIKIDIHTDKNGNVHINGKVNNEKELETLINDCLKNVSIQISDDKSKISKNVEVSLTIKEK
jgi:hypothetical protein